MTSRSFLHICLGLTAVLVGISLLLFSIDKATAKPDIDFSDLTTASPVPQQIGGGAIMMVPFNRTLYNDNGTQSYQETDILVWDTQTGKSKLYYFGYQDNQYGWRTMAYPLPSNPLK